MSATKRPFQIHKQKFFLVKQFFVKLFKIFLFKLPKSENDGTKLNKVLLHNRKQHSLDFFYQKKTFLRTNIAAQKRKFAQRVFSIKNLL